MKFLPFRLYETSEGLLMFLDEQEGYLYFSDYWGYVVEFELDVEFPESIINLN